MLVIGRSNGVAKWKFQRGCGDSWRRLAGGGGEGGGGDDGEANGKRRRRRRRQGRAGRNGRSSAARPGWVEGRRRWFA